MLAPMVNNSEEAFRILVKRYGCDICYTEMVHCRIFNESNAKADKNMWYTTREGDKPLIIQVAGNDPGEILEVCLKVQDKCDAIDINFGCPQEIARKGHYGSFLMDDWDLIKRIIKTLSKEISVPLFCKIRVFESIEKTVEYAKMIEASGCSLLAVHGRTREQRGQATGYVSFKHIKAVKEALSIPVISNGGVLENKDIESALELSGADGIMFGEPILFIPTICSTIPKTNIEIFEEYLTIVKDVNDSASNKHMKSHAFKMLKPILDEFPDLRAVLGKCRTIENYEDFIEHVKSLNPSNDALKLKPNIRTCYSVLSGEDDPLVKNMSENGQVNLDDCSKKHKGA